MQAVRTAAQAASRTAMQDSHAVGFDRWRWDMVTSVSAGEYGLYRQDERQIALVADRGRMDLLTTVQ